MSVGGGGVGGVGAVTDASRRGRDIRRFLLNIGKNSQISRGEVHPPHTTPQHVLMSETVAEYFLICKEMRGVTVAHTRIICCHV
jgi:hypothetical protein